MDRYFLRNRGTSLLEISIGLVVLGIILSMLLSAGIGIFLNAKSEKNTKDINAIAYACRQYYMRFNHWPTQAMDLKPFFISPSVSTQNYILTQQTNILSISSPTDTVTVVRPRGVMGYLDCMI